MTTERETWLAQVSEEALDPELPICDAHHHLWDYPENRYLPRALAVTVEAFGAAVGAVRELEREARL